MAEIIVVSATGPEEFPAYQSPENIARILASVKVGDVAHIFPKGQKLEYLVEHLGIDQIHGCIDTRSKKDGIVLWSTFYAFGGKAFKTDKSRTFRSPDIGTIEVEKAEIYIPKASEAKFAYMGETRVQLKDGIHLVKVDSFFNGIVSGLDMDGKRVSGGADFFIPA